MPGPSAGNSEIAYRLYDSQLIEYPNLREASHALDSTAAAGCANSDCDSNRTFQPLKVFTKSTREEDCQPDHAAETGKAAVIQRGKRVSDRRAAGNAPEGEK